jgi:hypothetical protein
MFETNEYFDGKVKSIAFSSTTESKTMPATVGVMAVGDYVFNTGDKEKMTVVSGAMTIKFLGTDETQTFNAGESFDVEENSSFDVVIKEETAYLCLYG